MQKKSTKATFYGPRFVLNFCSCIDGWKQENFTRVIQYKLDVTDIVSSQLYVCHILVSKKCQLQAGTIHGIGEKSC